MNDRDRQDDYGRHQQHGGSAFRGGEYDAPRQPHQWQADHPRQANTGEWGYDAQSRSGDDDRRPYRFSGQGEPGPQRGSPSRMFDDDWRNERHDAAPYRSERAGHRMRGYAGAEEEWRPQRSSSRRSSPVAYSRDFDASGGNDFSTFTGNDFGGRDFYNRGGGLAGGMRSSESYRPSYGFSSWFREDDDRHRSTDDYSSWRRYGESRGFLQRAGDEIASWFGDEDAAHRREQDRREDHRGEDHRGRGPASYTRSDERIREDANDHLTHDWCVDASNIIVSVKQGEVTLDGTVDSRQAKRRAEDCVDRILGVKHVQNNLRVQERRSDYRSGRSSEWREGEQLASSQGEASAASGASQTTGARTTEGIGSAAAAGVVNASGTRSRDKTE